MSPRRTPAETTAPAKPTRARPSRSRSVMSNLHSIVPCERPHRRLEQLPDLPVADLPGCLSLSPPSRRPALVGAGDALTTLEIGPAYLSHCREPTTVPFPAAARSPGAIAAPLESPAESTGRTGRGKVRDAVNSSSHPHTLGWSPDRLPCPHSGTNMVGRSTKTTRRPRAVKAISMAAGAIPRAIRCHSAV